MSPTTKCAEYETGTIVPGGVRNHAQRDERTSCIIDNLRDWRDIWDGDLSHWIQQSGFQSRAIYFQMGKFRSTPEGIGILRALALEPTGTEHGYQRGGVAILTESLKGMNGRVEWTKQTLTAI